jgi:hypothetical protein
MSVRVWLLDPAMIDQGARFVLHSPYVGAVVAGIGLGNLLVHAPRFREERVQTIGIGALSIGYLLDSASHFYLASSVIPSIGLAIVGLTTGSVALATYLGFSWADRQKGTSDSHFAIAAVAGIALLHFGSHVYMAVRGLLGTVYTSVGLFGGGWSGGLLILDWLLSRCTSYTASSGSMAAVPDEIGREPNLA